MKTTKLVITALFSALVFVVTAYLHIPAGPGYVNFGDAFLLVAAVLCGGLSGGFCGALGGALADIASGGYAFYAPFTAIIKFAEGLVCGLIVRAMRKKEKFNFHVAVLLAFVVSAILMALGYFVVNGCMYGWGVALTSLVSDFIQAGVSVVMAYALSIALAHISYTRQTFGLQRLVFGKKSNESNESNKKEEENE